MGSEYVEVNLFDNLMDYIHSYIDCNLCVPFFCSGQFIFAN